MDTRSQYLLAAIINSSDDAIISKTLEGIITSWNKGAERIFGYTAEEAVGKSITMIIPPDRLDEEPGILEKISRGERIDHYETVRVAKDGRLLDISITVSPIKNDAGEIIGASKIARDITERKQAERSIYEHREWLRVALTSIGDAVIATDNKGNVTFMNPVGESLTGWQQEDARGRPLEEVFNIINEETRGVVESPVQKVLREGIIVGLANHTLLISKQGKEIPIDDSGAPIKDDAGNLLGVILVFRDGTEKKRVERALNELLIREQEIRKQAEEANRLKDEFIATISHELRTPLTSMLGWTRLLRSCQLDPETAARALETIERNVKSQAQLIEDLLDISRIITGRLRLNMQPVDLQSVVKTAVDALRPAAEAKNIKLQITFGDRASIYGDYERLQQIVWNLLSNAIKFTPAGGKVHVQLNMAESNIELTVTDTGVGIKPEFLPFIFNRFTQADSSTTRTYGGLGLGLSIVKHLTELHGGTVGVLSKGEGKGTTFIVSLPAMGQRAESKPEPLPVTGPSIALSSASVPNDILRNQRVLAVDDEPETLILMQTIFEYYGAEVRIANSVETALKTLEEWLPTILVSDIGMPERDGFDLIKAVRERGAEKGGNIPAVALTAFARVEDRMKVLAAGYQMHVPKPVEPQELINIVAGLTKIIGKS